MIPHHVTYNFDGDGEVVVFLNGMTQSTRHWKGQASAFSEHFRVLTYDARGQGDTPVGTDELTLALHADDLASLLDALDVERAHLVGFSHGARVALAMANHHPHRLDRLVLCSATASPTALARTIVQAWYHVLHEGGLEAMTWCALPTILGNHYLEQNERLIPGIVRASVERNSVEGVRLLLRALMDYPELSELARGVQAPTLVISADEDLLVTPDGAAELAKLCGGEHVRVPGCGHTIPIEEPELFRRHVLAFLTG